MYGGGIGFKGIIQAFSKSIGFLCRRWRIFNEFSMHRKVIVSDVYLTLSWRYKGNKIERKTRRGEKLNSS